MDIYEFQDKYSNLISNFEKETGKCAIWNNNFTILFMNRLQQNNIKITFKLPKLLIPKRYHYLSEISEFWLEFLRDHSYFARKRVIEDYIIKYTIPKDKCDSIKIEFKGILCLLLKYGIIERYSLMVYKINQEKVREYK